MEIEFFIENNNNIVAIVYKHESLGRIVIVTGEINPHFSLQIYQSDGGKIDSVDMMEFLLKTLPHNKTEELRKA